MQVIFLRQSALPIQLAQMSGKSVRVRHMTVGVSKNWLLSIRNTAMQHLLLSKHHQKLQYTQRNGYNSFPVALSVALYNLPGCTAAGTANGQFTSTGYVPPLQSAQFPTPQPGRDCQGIIGALPNRFVLNRPHQFTHFILLRNMLHLLFKTLFPSAVRQIERNDVIFLASSSTEETVSRYFCTVVSLIQFPPRPGRLRSSSHISSSVMGNSFASGISFADCIAQ